MSVISNL